MIQNLRKLAQDAPPVFDMTTVAYAVSTDFVMQRNGIFEGRVRAVRVPVERALDIDTPFDFRIAEFLMNERQTGHGDA